MWFALQGDWITNSTREEVHFAVINNCLIWTRISLLAQCARMEEPVSLPRSLTGFSALPAVRRRNIVINNPFWLVFVGAPDRCSLPLPLTDNLLPQTTCITVWRLRFCVNNRFHFNGLLMSIFTAILTS